MDSTITINPYSLLLLSAAKNKAVGHYKQAKALAIDGKNSYDIVKLRESSHMLRIARTSHAALVDVAKALRDKVFEQWHGESEFYTSMEEALKAVKKIEPLYWATTTSIYNMTFSTQPTFFVSSTMKARLGTLYIMDFTEMNPPAWFIKEVCELCDETLTRHPKLHQPF